MLEAEDEEKRRRARRRRRGGEELRRVGTVENNSWLRMGKYLDMSA